MFRYREQWIAWYICTILETIINIICQQWLLLVLKAGYLTNTTYGYIKWTKYIKAKKAQEQAVALESDDAALVDDANSDDSSSVTDNSGIEQDGENKDEV